MTQGAQGPSPRGRPLHYGHSPLHCLPREIRGRYVFVSSTAGAAALLLERGYGMPAAPPNTAPSLSPSFELLQLLVNNIQDRRERGFALARHYGHPCLQNLACLQQLEPKQSVTAVFA